MKESYNPFTLEGKTILVTGASSGIGRTIAVECSRMGANVIITGRNEDRLNETFTSLEGNSNNSIVTDLTSEQGVDMVVSQSPVVDGIVLCAGVSSLVPFIMSSRKQLDKTFEINFFSQIELLRLFIKKKKINSGSSIVGISSIGGNKTFSTGICPYGASKAAFLSIMKTAAKELAPKYRVNCILPGQVNTPMVQKGELTGDQYEAYKKTVPMGRFGEPEDIAFATIYLLSDASSFVNGSEITVDGGVTLN